MAQQDTGLGWNAKDEWLTQSGNTTIANIGGLMGGTAFPGQPLPKNLSSAADVIARGLYFGTVRNSDGILDTVFVASASDATIYACEYGDPAMVGFYSDTKDSLVIWVRVREPGGAIQRQELNCTGAFSVTGGTVCRFTQQKYYASWNPSIAVPHFASNTEALNNLYYVNDPIKKKNEGFSVTCVAKWKTPNGTILESPVLISTESDYVEMESTDTSLDYAKLKILYNGINFYMGFYNRLYTGTLLALVPEIDISYESAPSFTLEELFKYIAKDIYANIQVTNAPDPYQEGNGSEEGGLDGEEDEADNVDFTDPPSTSIGATGLLTIFCPSLAQLQSLGNYMWSTFDVDNWRKIIANPMDAILGLHTLPIPAVITGTKAVKVAGIDTTIDMSYTTVRYIRRSLGTCEIPKKWGAYLDYSPYTKISIFLPFIGFKELDADDVMGKTIALQYMIDILTGACVAELKCENTVLYSWSGNCANEVPISGSDWRGAIASAIGIAATVAGTALVTGGATAPMAASMVASVGANSMNLKPTINRSGAISGSAGYMSQKRPYIIRSIPNLVIPADQNKFIGYPSFITASLGSLTGYNEIASIHLEGIPATGNELAEIETLLKGGVIF